MPDRWRPLAEQDTSNVADDIAQENLRAAREVGDESIRWVMKLADHPDIGRLGRIAGAQELVIIGLPYVVPYWVAGGEVEVLRVYHTAKSGPGSAEELESAKSLKTVGHR